MPYSLSPLARELQHLEQQGDYLAVIRTTKEAIRSHKRSVADPYVKAWLGRRWRNLFLQAAVHDKNALRAARRKLGKDPRPATQKIAERFLKGDQLTEWSLEMPAAQTDLKLSTSLVFCPGFINGMLPAHAFANEFPALQAEYGWDIMQADAHPMRGCDENAHDILAAVNHGHGFASNPGAASDQRRLAAAPEKVVLMGYSKGAPDILSALAKHPEALKDKVQCVVTWAGAIGGSYMADNFYQMIKELDTDTLTERLHDFLALLAPQTVRKGSLRRLNEYDIRGGIYSLTTMARQAFLKQYQKSLDELDIPVLNFTAATSVLEVPTFQMADYLNLSRYDGNNDMQVTQAQAKLDIPMSTHVAMLHGHHWDISYPPFPRTLRMASPNLEHSFPRKAAIIAIMQLLAETGLID